MQLCNLASGSRGNCTWVQSGASAILIDCGLGIREVLARIQEMQLDCKRLLGILVTHEHMDHIKGVDALSRLLRVPVYIHEKSWQACRTPLRPSKRADNTVEIPFSIGDLEIHPFRLPHDAAYHTGYRITDGKRTAVIATDLGYVSDATREKLRSADLVMLESNHDLEMLRRGSYPYPLKQRILSNVGHLSNDACADEVAGIVEAGAKTIVLSHLSQDNNTPEIAFERACAALSDMHAQEGKDVIIEVASQFRPTRCIEV